MTKINLTIVCECKNNNPVTSLLSMFILKLPLINPLSANVKYTPQDGDVTYSSCNDSYRTGKENLQRNDILHFVFRLSQWLEIALKS